MAKKASKRTARLKNLTKGQLGELALATSHALAEYQATIEARVPLFSGAKVIRAKASQKYTTIPEGAVVGFFANEGNKTLAALAQAAAKGDVKKVDALVMKIAEYDVENAGRIDDKPRGVSGVPVYGELRYRTKTISQGLFADKPSSVEMRLFPYNGGKLYEADFKLLNFKARDTAKSLECLLIQRDPVLTALEQSILAKVPREQTEANIAADAAFTGAIVKAITKGAKKIINAVVDGAKKAVDWARNLDTKQVVAFTTHFVTVMPSDCGLLPGGMGAVNIQAGSSAADLLNARRHALTSDLGEAINGR